MTHLFNTTALTLCSAMILTGCFYVPMPEGDEDWESPPAENIENSAVDGEAAPDDRTELLGYYEITSSTHNASGCESDGPANPDADVHEIFSLSWQSFFGPSWLEAAWCTDLADCEENIDTGGRGPSFRNDGNDTDGWVGPSGDVFLGGSLCFINCDERRTEHVLTSPAPGETRIETRYFAQDAEDVEYCDAMTVVTGSFIAPL